MITYLIRRYFLTLLLAPLLLFTVVVYGPGGALDTETKFQRGLYCDQCLFYWPAFATSFHLDKPWLSSYFTWLSDPDAVAYDTAGEKWVPKGIYFLGVFIAGSGVITGDLGYSASVEGVSVHDLIGHSIGPIAFVYAALLLALILLTEVMRFKRGYRGPIKPRNMPRDTHIPRFGVMPVQ